MQGSETPLTFTSKNMIKYVMIISLLFCKPGQWVAEHTCTFTVRPDTVSIAITWVKPALSTGWS